jgi:hypothetical protein
MAIGVANIKLFETAFFAGKSGTFERRAHGKKPTERAPSLAFGNLILRQRRPAPRLDGGGAVGRLHYK